MCNDRSRLGPFLIASHTFQSTNTKEWKDSVSQLVPVPYKMRFVPFSVRLTYWMVCLLFINKLLLAAGWSQLVGKRMHWMSVWSRGLNAPPWLVIRLNYTVSGINKKSGIMNELGRHTHEILQIFVLIFRFLSEFSYFSDFSENSKVRRNLEIWSTIKFRNKFPKNFWGRPPRPHFQYLELYFSNIYVIIFENYFELN